LIALVAFTAATYSGLPDQIPQRMDGSGTPTAFMAKAPLTWFLLPMIALATLGLLQGISAALPSKPSLFNFPEKARFLRIPERYRGPVIDEMRTMLDVTAILTLAVFAAVQLMLWRAAHGARDSGGMVVVLVLSVVLLPMILLFLPRLSAATSEAERRWRAEDPTDTLSAEAR
jgi:uncharacterized membrane protein